MKIRITDKNDEHCGCEFDGHRIYYDILHGLSDMAQTTIPYTLRSRSSKTPCPHGMKATCHTCDIKEPRLVHVGSWMERDCPFFVEDKGRRKGVVCNFIPDTFTIYNSR